MADAEPHGIYSNVTAQVSRESQRLNVTPFFKAWWFLNVVQRPQDWIWFLKPVSCMSACCCRPPSPPSCDFPQGKKKKATVFHAWSEQGLVPLGAGQVPHVQASWLHSRRRTCPEESETGHGPSWGQLRGLLVAMRPLGPRTGQAGGLACSGQPLGTRLTPAVTAGGRRERCRAAHPWDSLTVLPFGLSAWCSLGKATRQGRGW